MDLGADLSRPAPSGIRTSHFVGRETEVAELGRMLADGPAVVLIEGEAGIGKSRILAEFWASPEGARHRRVVAYCPPFRQPYTLGALVDAVRDEVGTVPPTGLTALAGALRPLFPEWAETLPPNPEPLEDPSASRHRLFRALSEVLACLDTTVLVVEDAHWADNATLEFLLHLASRPEQLRLVVTVRPDDVPADSLLLRLTSRAPSGGAPQLRIPLTPLDRAQSGGLVSSMLGDAPLSEEFAEFLRAGTDGIPFALEETVRLMHDRGELVRRDGRWLRRGTAEVVLPPTIRDATLDRVGRLGPSAQRVLGAAAVLTDASTEALVGEVAGLESGETSRGLIESLEAGLMIEDGRGYVAIRHALACRAVYEALPAPERRVLHRRAGHALERAARPSPGALTRHFRGAGDIVEWRTHAEHAASQALAAGDERTVADILHDLLLNAELPPCDVAAVASRVPFAVLSGDAIRELVEVFDRVAQEGELDARGVASIRVMSGNARWLIGDFDAAITEFEAAVPHLDDPVTASQVMSLLAWPRDSSTSAERHLAWLQRAQEIAGSLGPDDALRLLARRVTALLMLGEQEGWDEATRLPADTDVPTQRMAVVTGHLNLGDAAMAWGRYEDAERSLDMAARLAECFDYQHLLEMVTVNQARLAWFRGSWDDLASRLPELGVDGALLAGSAERPLLAGLLQWAHGATARAEALLRDSLEKARLTGATDYCLEPAGALARLRLREGDVDEAIGLTEDVTNVLVRKGIWLWATDVVPVRVDALVRAGRIDDAATLVVAFARGMRNRPIATTQAALLESQAIVEQAQGRPDRAAATFARAAESWGALPRPYDAALARARRADCLVSSGQVEGGVVALEAVLHDLSRLGARGDADRVLRELRALGVDVRRPHGGGRPSYGNALSPREREVVILVSRGHTNRQIAEQLVLSVQTVTSHVRSAMRKVQAPSRTALAVRSAELGLLSDDPA